MAKSEITMSSTQEGFWLDMIILKLEWDASKQLLLNIAFIKLRWSTTLFSHRILKLRTNIIFVNSHTVVRSLSCFYYLPLLLKLYIKTFYQCFLKTFYLNVNWISILILEKSCINNHWWFCFRILIADAPQLTTCQKEAHLLKDSENKV